MFASLISNFLFNSQYDKYDPWLLGKGYLKWYQNVIYKTVGKPLPTNLTANRIGNFMSGRCGRFTASQNKCRYVMKATRVFLTLSFFDRTHEWEQFISLQTVKRKYDMLYDIKNKLFYSYLIEGWRPKTDADVVTKLPILDEGEPLKGERLEQLKKLAYAVASLMQRPTINYFSNDNINIIAPYDIIDSGLAEDYPTSLLLAYLGAESLSGFTLIPYYIYNKREGFYELRVAIISKHPLMTTSETIEKEAMGFIDDLISFIGGKPTNLHYPDGTAAVVKTAKTKEEANEWIKGDLLIAMIEKAA